MRPPGEPAPEAADGDAAADRVEVATVAKAHGIRGEVLAVSIDPSSETLGAVEQVWIGGRRFVVVAARPVGGAYLLALEGLTDRDAAAALRGQVVEVGNHEELMVREGHYYKLYQAQARNPDGDADVSVSDEEKGD